MSNLKDSGVYWLGEVASDWDLVPAWRVMRERSEKSRPDDVHLTPSQTYGVITQEDYMSITGNKVVLNLTGSANMKRVHAGDFVIHLRSFQGGIEASAIGGKVSNAYTVLSPSSDAHFDYYRWFMKSAPLIEGLASSTDQLRDGQSINFGRFSRFTLPLPPLDTQQRIADYLDRETAEIDAAVADLDKYVELLKKREEILVEELLCKSRFPKVPLFTFCHLSSGDGIDKGNLEHSGRFPVYGGNGVMGYSDRSNRNQDTLVVGRVGALCGNVHYAKAPFFVTDNALVLSLKSDVSLDWLQFALRNLRLRDLSQSSAQPVITATTVLRQRVSLPPAPRQLQIASRIGEETAEIKALIAESTKLRDLLLQRRSVLITEVVTGRKQV